MSVRDSLSKDQAGALEMIEATPGKRFRSVGMAPKFKKSISEMTRLLRSLSDLGLVRAMVDGTQTKFYVPSAEELAAEARAAERREFRPLVGYSAALDLFRANCEATRG